MREQRSGVAGRWLELSTDDKALGLKTHRPISLMLHGESRSAWGAPTQVAADYLLKFEYRARSSSSRCMCRIREGAFNVRQKAMAPRLSSVRWCCQARTACATLRWTGTAGRAGCERPAAQQCFHDSNRLCCVSIQRARRDLMPGTAGWFEQTLVEQDPAEQAGDGHD